MSFLLDKHKVRAMKDHNSEKGTHMEYQKISRRVGGIDTAKLALWGALIAVVIVAGIAVLSAGSS